MTSCLGLLLRKAVSTTHLESSVVLLFCDNLKGFENILLLSGNDLRFFEASQENEKD